MSLYEITFLTKEETDPGVRAALEEAGGTINEESTLGRRRLAYPIKKESQAVYTSFGFDIAPAQLAGVNRKLGLNTNILRYLVVSQVQERPDKEVSKTVREAIAAAEKLEDFAEPVVAPVEPSIAEPTVAVELPKEIIAPTVEPEVPVAKPTPKPKVKKAEPVEENAATATEEDRLKALDEKLGEILKD